MTEYENDPDYKNLMALIKRITTDKDFRAKFKKDPSDAIASSGVTLSPRAKSALLENREKALTLLGGEPGPAPAFFFYFFFALPPKSPPPPPPPKPKTQV